MIEKLKKSIVEQLDVNLSYQELDQTTPLFKDGLAMDSIVFTEFIVLFEQSFSVEFDDEQLAVENFFNLEKIAETIDAHRVAS